MFTVTTDDDDNGTKFVDLAPPHQIHRETLGWWVALAGNVTTAAKQKQQLMVKFEHFCMARE